MNSREIRELIELISSSDVESFELERDDLKLKIVRPGQRGAVPPPPPAAVAPEPVSAPPAPQASAAAASRPAAPPAEGLIDVPAPIVGTFYASPSPDAAPFVTVGSRVEKGQTVCIVEAMKVMNEIECEHSGEIAEVLVTNGQPIEFGEVMFRLRPA